MLSSNHALREQSQLLRGQILAGLNVWRSTESEQSERSEFPAFRETLRRYLGIPEGEDRRVVCQVSGVKGSDVIAAHIFPATANATLLPLIGLEPTDVNNERNGLFLANGIEKAFDRQQVTFTLGADGQLRLRVLDGKLHNISCIKYSGWSNKDKNSNTLGPVGEPSFESLEGKVLNFATETPPFRRLLALHSELSSIKVLVNAWKPLDKAALDKDMQNLPDFRRLSGPNPLFPIEAFELDEAKREE